MKLQGSCIEDCPVIRMLRGETDVETLSLFQGSVAEDLAHLPNATEQIMEACELGGPTRPILSFGHLACRSSLVQARTFFLQQDITRQLSGNSLL